MREALLLVCTTCLYAFQAGAPAKFVITPEIQAAVEHVRADSLRGDLAFLSSDLLEGRATPSRGLDIAAEYIAAQFRRAGIEPGGVDGYFQSARLLVLETNMTGFELRLSHDKQSVTADPADVIVSSNTALDLKEAPILKLDLSDAAQVEELTPGHVNGKVVLMELGRNGQSNFRGLFQKLRQAKPAVLITVARSTGGQRISSEGVLTDPEEPRASTPRITLIGPAGVAFYESLGAGASGATASLHLAAPHETPVTPRNVAGVLRGSDTALKDTYLLVTAHYDHLGKLPDGPGDRIFNGANDDGSGTVSVIEVARALAPLKTRPRRSIVFMTFFGEEKGLMGSRYYAKHPLFPIDKTVGQLNLEQLGRTDDSEGARIATATVTGFDYSTLTDSIQAAGELTGIKVFKHPKNSDLYFTASDNSSLAEAGVPAHTIAVTFQFPDYHGVGDEWQKIDYDNLAKVDRMVTLATLMVANSDTPPRWNETNSKTKAFVKAWKDLHH